MYLENGSGRGEGRPRGSGGAIGRRMEKLDEAIMIKRVAVLDAILKLTIDGNKFPLRTSNSGSRWVEVAIPANDDGYTFFNAITAVSPADVWAVDVAGVNPIKPLTIHWDGTAGTYVSNPTLQSLLGNDH